MLETMIGREGGLADEITKFTLPLTGAFYFIPSAERLAALGDDRRAWRSQEGGKGQGDQNVPPPSISDSRLADPRTARLFTLVTDATLAALTEPEATDTFGPWRRPLLHLSVERLPPV
jgi:hypothetical protein